MKTFPPVFQSVVFLPGIEKSFDTVLYVVLMTRGSFKRKLKGMENRDSQKKKKRMLFILIHESSQREYLVVGILQILNDIIDRNDRSLPPASRG
jgi:hypothetical protein